MKVKKLSFLDNLAYALMVVFSLGVIWLIRVVITQAIIYAIKNEESL